MFRKLVSLAKEMVKPGNRRLLAAMASYLVLIGAAVYALLPVHTSKDSFLLIAVIGFLTYLMLKTLAHADDD
jgi:hypothetical protein